MARGRALGPCKTIVGQYSPEYSPVLLEVVRFVSSLLYGTRATLVLNLLAFENKKCTAYDRMAKSQARKNKSERSDLPRGLPCHVIIRISITQLVD